MKRTMFDNLLELAVECRKIAALWVRYSRYATDTGVIADIQNALRQGAFVTLRQSIDGSMNQEKLCNAGSGHRHWRNRPVLAARTKKGRAQVRINLSDGMPAPSWVHVYDRDVITISEKPLTTPADYTPAEQTAAMNRVKVVL
jgi:hypothetical protein